MSQKTEKNFSLNEWVTRRAANGHMNASDEQSAESALPERMAVAQAGQARDVLSPSQSVVSASAAGRRVVVEMPAPRAQAEQETDTENEMPSAVTKKEAPVQNASVTPVSSIGGMVAAGQQIQIVRLLQDLGDRLRQSEKEREVLWRELENARRTISDMDDKLSKSEKMWVTLESRMAQDPNAQAQNQEREKERSEMMAYRRRIEEKLAALETTTGSALVRVEDALAESAKVSKRLEQTQHDRARLQRKIESLEDAVTQTQDALKAKALVLLTDQALANRTGLPQMPAVAREEAPRIQTQPQVAPVLNARQEQMKDPLRAYSFQQKIEQVRNFFDRGFLKTALIGVVIGLGLAGGWWLATRAPQTAPVVNSQLQQGIVEPVAQSQEQLMNDIARMANQIEPGATSTAANDPVVTDESVTPAEIARTLEQQAKAQFDGTKPMTPVTERIQADGDLPASVRDMETKAFQNDGEAQHDLAAIYTAGHAGVKKDLAKARAWFTQAAHNNVANAQYNLGVLHHQGLGMPANMNEAMILYRLAAAQNHPEAQYNLGIAHIEGIGAERNPALAAYYFEQAAANGVVEAAYNLGLIFENGMLGEAQPDEAVFWYKLAADRGNQSARAALTKLTQQLGMTRDDVNRIVARIQSTKPDALGKAQAAPDNSSAVTTTPAPTTAPVPAKPKAQAAANPTVTAKIQDQLSQLGLYDGAADGVINSKTSDAIRAYQQNAGLDVDGKPSEDLLIRLLASDMNLPTP
jgi:TPR repeat protein